MPKTIKRRNTKQRRIILEELRKVTSHPTAYELFKMVKRKLPSIGFGTVYRNLSLLKNQGKILELNCGKYCSHYDGSTDIHYHFFCLKCERVFDVEIPTFKDLDKKVGRKTDFKIKYHRIDFYGYCKGCE